jgi:hypothetical protein
VGNTIQRGNGTSRTATLRSVGERTKDGNSSPNRPEGEGLGSSNSPITTDNRFEPLDSFEEEVQSFRLNATGPYEPFDRLEVIDEEDDGDTERSDGDGLTPEQLQAKERYLEEAAQRRLHQNAVKEEEDKGEKQAAVQVPTQSNDRKNDGQRDEQEMRQDRSPHGPRNEQKDWKDDGQREGQTNGTPEEENENYTENQNREENGPTDEKTEGQNEELEEGPTGCHIDRQSNEQTVTQQQDLVTPVKAGTGRSRGSDDGNIDASRAGSDDGQKLKGNEQKGVEPRDVKTAEGDHQRESDTKAQLDEEENVRAGEGVSPNDLEIGAKEDGKQIVDTEAGTVREGFEGPDGAVASGSNFSNMPDESPVARRTRGRRFLNSAQENQQHNSSSDMRAEVGRENEVLTGNDQPRQGRRPGRRNRLTHEVRWGLRVGQ